MFKALLVEKLEEKVISQSVTEISEDRLPDGNVTVRIAYSNLNYKDGLCVLGKGGLVRNFPHVPGIDFAGTVESSDDPRYNPGNEVVLTGWRVGEVQWGGYAQKARVNADWLVPLPDGLSAKQAMAVGTAGLTAMLAVMALEAHGLSPEKGPVLVTGAAGGVGSIATSILGNLGYEVDAVTGRPDQEAFLKSLGASSVIARSEIADAPERPLARERWAGCVDAVGGAMLSNVLTQMRYGGSVAAVGLAGGAAIEGATVVPFLLRGVNLLGIDSVMQPYENRLKAWKRITTDLPLKNLETATSEATLSDLPQLGKDILAGRVRGRVVIDVNR